MNKLVVSALSIALSASTLSFSQCLAGEVILTGRFEPGYDVGYVDSDYDYTAGDTSGDQYGDLVYFSNSALSPSPKTLSFDTVNYGEVSETFTEVATLLFTSAGEFYQLIGPTGWLAVDIVYPGRGISSFSFIDYGVSAPPPPSCVLNCGGDPPVVAAPEPSTWVMMLIGFAALSWATMTKRRRVMS